MKFLCCLLGAVVGAISGLIMVFFAVEAFLGQGRDGKFLMLFLLSPLSLLTGLLFGALIANRLRCRVAGQSPPLAPRVKFWYVARFLVSIGVIDSTLACLGVQTFYPPSDRALISNWEHNEPAFNQMVQMLQKDKNLSYVNQGWYADKVGNHDKAMQPRVDKYWRLLRTTNLSYGFGADEKREQFTFKSWEAGGYLPVTAQKGYFYSPVPPHPLVKSLEYAPLITPFLLPSSSPLRIRNGYRHIKGNWYLSYYSASQ